MSEPSGNALVDMLIADGATTQPTVMGELMRERFDGDRNIRQVEERWVPDGSLDRGHWETIEVLDVGPAPA